MGQTQIVVNNLSKTYRVPERQPGLVASLKGLVRRTWREVEAVRDVSLTVEAGEMVGFIGPNGAGKTTTLKMLSGLLYPTAGEARVLGFVPWQRKPDYLRRISMVLGNKSQMMWDIPPLDTFAVLGELYHVPQTDWQQTVDELVELLEMQELLAKPVRNMSLGERMKCELVAGLLHRPDVLYLDEPTLGLDVSMQVRLRRFLAEYNRRSEVTVILTSHYMADVTALCPRVILIHEGRLLYDGELGALAEQLAPFKLIQVALSNEVVEATPDDTSGLDLPPDVIYPPDVVCPPDVVYPPGAELVERTNGHLTLRVARAQAPSVTAWLLNTLPVVDLSVEDPPIEAVIDQVYQAGDVGGRK